MNQFTFEKLEVWQKSRSLVSDTYKLISKFPMSERYGLSNQLGRSIVSVCSNIAEGCGRPSIKERVHFMEIAYGSLMEALTQLIISCDLGFVESEELEDLRENIEEVAKMLSGLRKYLLSQA